MNINQTDYKWSNYRTPNQILFWGLRKISLLGNEFNLVRLDFSTRQTFPWRRFPIAGVPGHNVRSSGAKKYRMRVSVALHRGRLRASFLRSSIHFRRSSCGGEGKNTTDRAAAGMQPVRQVCSTISLSNLAEPHGSGHSCFLIKFLSARATLRAVYEPESE